MQELWGEVSPLLWAVGTHPTPGALPGRETLFVAWPLAANKQIVVLERICSNLIPHREGKTQRPQGSATAFSLVDWGSSLSLGSPPSPILW